MTYCTWVLCLIKISEKIKNIKAPRTRVLPQRWTTASNYTRRGGAKSTVGENNRTNITEEQGRTWSDTVGVKKDYGAAGAASSLLLHRYLHCIGSIVCRAVTAAESGVETKLCPEALSTRVRSVIISDSGSYPEDTRTAAAASTAAPRQITGDFDPARQVAMSTRSFRYDSM